LQELERRAAFLIERSNFAVEDEVFGWQQLQGTDQLRVIERLIVARDQPHIFSVFESQGPVPIVFDFVEPIALRQFFDQSAFFGSVKEGAFWTLAFTFCHYPYDERAE
jgi:hypothetical protein